MFYCKAAVQMTSQLSIDPKRIRKKNYFLHDESKKDKVLTLWLWSIGEATPIAPNKTLSDMPGK
jgi:hypothetical protein